MTSQTGKAQEPRMVNRSSSDASSLGPMPVWNLSDLYPEPESPAVEADLEKSRAATKCIQERYQGKLGELAADGKLLGAKPLPPTRR